jgi:hypothetical protein
MKEDWASKVAWMREAVAVDASWHPDGSLAQVTLAPAPSSASKDPAEQQESPVQRAQRERTERSQTLSRLSGGPVRRPDEGD